MLKAVVIKQPGQLFWWPQATLQVHLHLQCTKEAGLLYKRDRFFLKERLSVVYITRPVFTGIGLQFVLRHPGGVDQNISREIHAEEPGIVCCKPIKTAKRVLLLVLWWKVFCHWIPLKIPVLKTMFQVLQLKVLSTNRSGLGRSTIQLGQDRLINLHVCLLVHMDAKLQEVVCL